jgi:tRNA-splicing ligase RtcB
MPDAHLGFGMPIGGVMATRDVIIPNAVGVDIGCGMCAVKTSLKTIEKESLLAILNEIKRSVPVGFRHHKKKQSQQRLPKPTVQTPVVKKQYPSALNQIGTLGGGNHFIEIQQGSDGFVWLMVHSGSRNVGYQVANHYNKLAVRLNQKKGAPIPKNWGLAFLPLDSELGQTYKAEMEYCVNFALANRRLMMDRIKNAVAAIFSETLFGEMINIAHNYAALEKHFGQKVMVHRKGATQARAGQLGIIPGSQGAMSYIVKGLGNPESFESCSHGAGRKMGRKQAQRQLDLAKEQKKLDDMGVIHSVYRKKDLDEAAGAYKEISVVMANQTDLVEIFVELRPLAVIKG